MALTILLSVPIIAAILSLAVKREHKNILEYLAFGSIIIELGAAFKIIEEVISRGFYSASQYFYVDSLSALMLVVIMTVAAPAVAYSVGYLRTEVKKEIIGFSRVRQYFVLLHLFLFTMLFAVQAANPIMIWIAIEATTLSTAFLISFYGKPSSIEAAWKYLIINSVGLLLGFLGTLIFIFVSSNAANGGFLNWQEMIALAPGFDGMLAKVSFVFVLIGYGTKMGLVPMHTWLPDAHSKAPTPISGLLSGVLLNVAFYAILRFKMITDSAAGARFSQDLLVLFGLISVILPAFIILIQKNYKRLLAYSSIEHMGIVALGFGFGGIGVFAALLHIIYHALAKSLLFFSAGNVFLKYSSTKIFNVRGVATALPVTSVLFLSGIAAIIGLPPFGLFFTEFYILSAGIGAHPLATLLLVAGSALAFLGFFRHATSMMFGKPPSETVKGESGIWTILPLGMLLAVLAVLSFFVPPFLSTLLANSAKLF